MNSIKNTRWAVRSDLSRLILWPVWQGPWGYSPYAAISELKGWVSKKAMLAVFLTGCALAACGGNTQTVNGKVLDANNQPFAGQTVVISSGTFKKTAVTDSNGAFSVPNVPTPYNATILDTLDNFAIEYEGLTRDDPALSDLVAIPQQRNAVLNGQLTGGSYPEPANYDTAILFASPETQEFISHQNSGSYSSRIQWPGPTTTTGTLYALQVQRLSAFGLPMAYAGYGTLSGVQLQDQATMPGRDIHLDAVTSATLSGTVNPQPEYTVNFKSLGLFVAKGVAIRLLEDSSADTSFAYVAPSIPGTSIAIQASAATATGEYAGVQKTGLAANATGLTLALPAAPTLALPADAATGITVATPFTWSAFAGGVNLLFVYPKNDESLPTFLVITATPTTTIPDLASVGLSLPPSSAYSWYVSAVAPVAGVDAVAAPGGLSAVGTGDYTQGITPSRSFVTGP
jgi:hypothetical protein